MGEDEPDSSIDHGDDNDAIAGKASRYSVFAVPSPTLKDRLSVAEQRANQAEKEVDPESGSLSKTRNQNSRSKMIYIFLSQYTLLFLHSSLKCGNCFPS